MEKKNILIIELIRQKENAKWRCAPSRYRVRADNRYLAHSLPDGPGKEGMENPNENQNHAERKNIVKKTGKSGSSLLGFNGQFGEVDTSISCVEWREQASEVEYRSKLALFT